MNVAVVGEGAFGVKHLEAIRAIEGVSVVSLCGGVDATIADVARTFGIPHTTRDLAETLAQPHLDAVVIASPTQLHATQAIQCMRAGKHVLIEIPIADSLHDAEQIAAVANETGTIAVAGHVRRFNPSHQWVHRRIVAGEYRVQQMDVQTYFFRRKNINAKGEPRSWTDHLLWHHAAHTVDLFAWQTGAEPAIANAIAGPPHPELGIAMDVSIQLQVPAGAILTLSLSFNNDGPLGSFFRYIGNTGTYIANYDDLTDGRGNAIDTSAIDVSTNGIELEDRAFFDAVTTGQVLQNAVADVLGTYRTLDRLEAQIGRVVR